jgi:hypothetical protein
MRLLRQLLEVHRVHRAFEPDVQRAYRPLAHGDDLHARKIELLEKMRSVFLIAGESVEGFGENDLALAAECITEQSAEAGAGQHRRARDSRVGVFGDHRPTLAGRELTADAELILDRGGALLVSAVTGVESDTHHQDTFGLPPSSSAKYSRAACRPNSRAAAPAAACRTRWLSESLKSGRTLAVSDVDTFVRRRRFPGSTNGTIGDLALMIRRVETDPNEMDAKRLASLQRPPRARDDEARWNAARSTC